MKVKLIIAIVLAAYAFSANAIVPEPRKQSTRIEFIKISACPSTGKHAFPCKGYIVDHVIPLCAGGHDAVSNMQWQTKADSYKKDVLERKQCAALKKK